MDWESMAAELKKERSAGVLSAAPAAGRLLPDFPELAAAAAGPEPMELEEALPVTLAAGGGATARALIVVDTNVLISHPATLERLLHALAAAADPPSAARESRSLEVQALVPWIVLNELDRLKSSPDGGKAAAAAHALQRLRLLLMTRDAGIRGQTAAEHAAVSDEEGWEGDVVPEIGRVLVDGAREGGGARRGRCCGSGSTACSQKAHEQTTGARSHDKALHALTHANRRSQRLQYPHLLTVPGHGGCGGGGGRRKGQHQQRHRHHPELPVLCIPAVVGETDGALAALWPECACLRD